MASFSDYYNSNATPGVVASLAGTLPLDTERRQIAGIGHSRYRTKRMHMNVGTVAVIGEELRMGQFKSGDRLFRLNMSTDAGGTGGLVDIGFFEAGFAHDGVVVEVDIIAAALDVTTAALDDVDEFAAGALTGIHRGLPLWEITNVGASSYTEDPMEDWDLVMVPTVAFTVAVTDFVLVAEYTSGG